MDRILTSKRARVYFHIYNMFFQILLAILTAKLCLDYLPVSFGEYMIITFLLTYSGSLIFSKIYIPIHLGYMSTGRDYIPLSVNYFMLLFMGVISISLGWGVYAFSNSVFLGIYITIFFFFGALWWNVTLRQLIEVIEEQEVEILIKESPKKI